MAKIPARKKTVVPVRWKVLLVTYDLTNTVPGDPRYKEADDALAMQGDLFRPIKQIRLLLTQKSSLQVRNSLEQRIGLNTSMLIIEMRNVRQLRIANRAKRAEWERFEAALEAVGLDITGL